MDSIQAVSVRLTKPLHGAVTELAKRRNVSVNRLIEQEFARAVEEEERAKLREGFRLLAGEPVDVEFAFEAQAEVALRDAS
ncbi:hypothetical protein EON81_25915 [bacterium]|nr:MAG: hypothetical protein EON81_25915 [bacterium]